MKVGEGRPGERGGEGKGRERRIGEDKAEEDTDFPKEGSGPLNWSCGGPLSILAFEILFKSTAVSKDRRMQVKRTADGGMRARIIRTRRRRL